MLTYEQIYDICARVTYKPGWEISVYQHDFEGIWSYIYAKVENSYRPGEMVDLGIRSPIPPVASEKQFLSWLSWRLGIIESHEMREWLKIDGEVIFDPHAEGANE